MKSELIRRLSTGNRCLIMMTLLACISSTAHASTYLYSFTTDEVVAAIEASFPGQTAQSGYFAIFLQPDLDPSAYTISQVVSPKGGASGWLGATVNDPSDLGYPGDWAQFSKQPIQSQVSLVSAANGGPGGANIFLYPPPPNNHFSNGDATIHPQEFGSDGALVALIADTARWYFKVNTTEMAPTHFFGAAALIFSNSLDHFDPPDPSKTELAGFDMTLLVTAPEPGSLALTTFGALLLAVAVRRRNSAREHV